MSCPDCFKGTIHDGTPKGTVTDLHGTKTYITTCESSTTAPTILFLTDAFGFNLINSKLLADIYATRIGARVLVPDIIPGGGVPVTSLQLMNSITAPVAWYDILGQLRRVVTIVRMMSIFIPFARRTRNAFPGILSYARAVRADLPAGAALGVVGFCWGAGMSMKLAKEAAVEGGKERLIDAQFVAHPSGLKVPDDVVTGIEQWNVPCSIAVGDRDMILKNEKVEELEAALRRKSDADEAFVSELVVYEGCGHGFAVRADPTKNLENDGAQKAVEQAVQWFKRYLF